MSYVIFGSKQTQIILYMDDGVTPQYRVTLQKETAEGLTIALKPEGVSRQLGSGAGWANRWLHRGFRPSLTVQWTHGVQSQVETWSGGAWTGLTTIPTAQALSIIHTWACHNPCLVYPHLDVNFSFQAQPDPGKAFNLRDAKGVIHTSLELALIGTTLLPDIPDWINLNNYFTPGYVADGYIGSTP